MSVTHLIALTTLSCPLFQLEQSFHWTQSRTFSKGKWLLLSSVEPERPKIQPSPPPAREQHKLSVWEMSPLCGRKSDIRLCRPDCGVATTGSVQDQTVSAERGRWGCWFRTSRRQPAICLRFMYIIPAIWYPIFTSNIQQPTRHTASWSCLTTGGDSDSEMNQIMLRCEVWGVFPLCCI